LHELLERGLKNGVKNLRILNRDQVRALEPHVHEDVCAALFSPDAGTVTPYEFAIALAENAVDNVRCKKSLLGI
jgi:glycerol-3-phosphate dehydrogenase